MQALSFLCLPMLVHLFLILSSLVQSSNQRKNMLDQALCPKKTFLFLFIFTSLFSVAQSPEHIEQPTDDVSQSWLSTIESDLENKEYHVSFDEETQSFQSPNRANNIRAHYNAGQLNLQNRMDSAGHNWECSIKTESVLIDNNKAYTPQKDVQEHIAGNTIEFAHTDFTEQYINSKEGTRQNFIIHKAPSNSSNVAISLAVSGLEVNQVTDNELHLYQTINGVKEVRLVYKDLKSWDATGASLTGKIQYIKGHIQLVVNTENATFPVTIDPLYAFYNPMFSSGQASAHMGYSVSSAGDVNGDGYSDVIVGVRYYDNGQTDEGAAFVYHGSATGLSTTASSQLESNQASAQMGWSVSSAGDVNGDGYSDVIVGARLYDNGQSNEGAAFVYHGSASGLNTTHSSQLERNQANAHMGTSVASAGDVNGDGYSDVIVGAFLYDNGQTDEGAAFVYHGSSSGLSTTASSQLERNQANARMGRAVSSAGDVNGDGYSDVIVGAYAYDNGQTNEGAAFVYYGNAGGGMRNNLRLYDDNLSSLFTDASFSDGNMGIGLFAKSPQGKQKGKIVYETIASGSAYSSSSPITNSTQYTGQASSYTALGLTGTELKLAITKVSGSTRVRARVKYDPATSITGQVYGPWKYLLINSQSLSVGTVPVELTYFEAEKQSDNHALLSWQTASELNNKHFEIERQVFGAVEFEKIGEVAGAGNSQQLRDYTFTDDISELSGRICYRIKQVDYDHVSEYTEVRCVTKLSDNQVLIYPNPTKGMLNIDLLDQEESVTIQIISLSGVVVKELQTITSTQIDVSDLEGGIYFVQGQSRSGSTFIQKLIVQ